MDEIKLHNVQPLPGQKSVDRVQPKPLGAGPGGGGAFEQALKQADALMDGVNRNLSATAEQAKLDSSGSIETEFQANQKLFQQTMEVKNVLAKLFLDMNKGVSKG
jgi:hypothetical protein